ncbi:putative secreted protein (Por secretion system target) [Ulvibacter sp. MAR_2010_11]|uniref:type IX secretion system anionic LPS delivery protein PorZ n=1 Tax=Ulvibacter sp. MAR_2010_11 TaxID=1250229 RepID=UPI000C2BBAF9|nr:two-component regulator propeller domain-containing protein [Ulvibacter sp. MAR_2010_11]PKA83065.1 putative secreted protein (Por secretion system target) [Ulvibacter sp. MAR_2010_11]
MKQLGSIILLFVTISIQAQNFESQWTGHFSYRSVKSISQGNDRVYTAAENAVFTYDLSTLEINTISTINGLSGERISSIYYSENFKLLIIGYENGLMDIVIDGDEDILTVVDILDKPTIPPDRKRINHFNEYNGNLYISTQYGISVYDLAALEFGDTYFIGDIGEQIEISQTTVQEPYIFAASTTQGIKRALVEDDNLIDFQNWTTVLTGGWNGVQTLNTELYAVSVNNNVVRFTPQGASNTVQSFNAAVVDFMAFDDLLTITTPNAIRSYSEGFVLQASTNSTANFEYKLQSGLAFNSTFYMGTTELGMLIVPFGSNTAMEILPDGPLLNQPFAIAASPGQLWVNFGDVDVNFNPFPLSARGISNLKESVWTNIEYEDLEAAVGTAVTDLVEISINPNDPDETYMSSFHKGLLKINELTPTILYNETNSPIQIPQNNPDPAGVGIRLYGSDFDRDGNLWTVQSFTNDALIRRSPQGQFQIVDISVVVDGENELALSDLKVSREGFVFFGATQSGLVGYNPNSNQFNIISTEIGSGNLPTNNIRALAFDNQNRLWIGTLTGLRVLFNVGGFFEEGANTDAQPIIILDGDVAQELLFEQSITDIEVDGSNNKWIATATSGVFYLSSNGQETLLRFTKENSPLPSNNVQDIAIDAASGVVYFATVNGLVAYNGTATAPRDNLEGVYVFPNPVRPGFNGNVTIDGLTARANVKITDIEGNLVFEETSEGGSILWDTTAFGKYRVRSGVYLVLITTDDALETKVSKIMIIR